MKGRSVVKGGNLMEWRKIDRGRLRTKGMMKWVGFLCFFLVFYFYFGGMCFGFALVSKEI